MLKLSRPNTSRLWTFFLSHLSLWLWCWFDFSFCLRLLTLLNCAATLKHVRTINETKGWRVFRLRRWRFWNGRHGLHSRGWNNDFWFAIKLSSARNCSLKHFSRSFHPAIHCRDVYFGEPSFHEPPIALIQSSSSWKSFPLNYSSNEICLRAPTL